jgi:hypothetical protein
MALATAVVTMTATDTGVATFSPALTSNPPKLLGQGVIITDGAGPVAVTVSGLTNTGCTVNASGPFTGTITLFASD